MCSEGSPPKSVLTQKHKASTVNVLHHKSEGVFLQLSGEACSTSVNMEKNHAMTYPITIMRRNHEKLFFCPYSPDNTKGSISNRSIRLNIQLLLWMMRVLMMVRLNCSSCGSLYLSWGCCSWPRSLTRCG